MSSPNQTYYKYKLHVKPEIFLEMPRINLFPLKPWFDLETKPSTCSALIHKQLKDTPG
jgi:hypothetical protein